VKLFHRKPKRAEEKPHFRFYPGAYEDGGPLVASLETCGCCGEPCVWKYTGNVYAREKVTVCAGCIAADNLSNVFKDGYSLHDVELEQDVEDTLNDELFGRTPGVACFNPFEWPVADGAPMVFVGYGENLTKDPDAIAATKIAFTELGWHGDSRPSTYTLLFRPLNGGAMRAVIDLD